nr:hypothetical protein [Tanacetum cinerariifolium]
STVLDQNCLGVPLVPSRLVYKDCKELIEKVEARVNDWKNKSLSIIGCCFCACTRILLDIEQLMRGFLWCQGSMRKGKAKVAWDVVCLPKDEGGLGVRRLDSFNKALMSVHIWKLLLRKDSLWVKWIHLYKIMDRKIWDIPCRGNMTWGWRKVLQLRPCIREFIWHKIENRSSASLWFDQWCPLSPPADFISSRDIFQASLNFSTKVADLLGSGTLEWPHELGVKYLNVLLISSPQLNQGVIDKLVWRSRSGAIKPFAVNSVWQDICPRDVKVAWVDAVWFSNCIPRHAFNLWLIIKRKLKTQDRLRSWDISNSLAANCSLCESHPDSHGHLFFDCPFSTHVWLHMRDMADLSHLPPYFDEIQANVLSFQEVQVVLVGYGDGFGWLRMVVICWKFMSEKKVACW